jgi:hypothetical protein
MAAMVFPFHGIRPSLLDAMSVNVAIMLENADGRQEQ